MHKSRLTTDCGRDCVWELLSLAIALTFETMGAKIVATMKDKINTAPRLNLALEYIVTAYKKSS